MFAATAIAIFIIPVLFVLVERLATHRLEAPHVALEPGTSEGRA